MFSSAVYVFGHQFSSSPSILDFKEELPDGTKVAQGKLSEAAVFAALMYLYEKKFIDLFVQEGKILFVKTKTAKVKKLKEQAEGLEGLELNLFTAMRTEMDVYGAVRALLRDDVMNPWGEILELVKRNLLAKGILERVEKGKVLMITTHKNILKHGIPHEYQQILEQLKQSTEGFKKQEELYAKVTSDVIKGIKSRQEQANDD